MDEESRNDQPKDNGEGQSDPENGDPHGEGEDGAVPGQPPLEPVTPGSEPPLHEQSFTEDELTRDLESGVAGSPPSETTIENQSEASSTGNPSHDAPEAPGTETAAPQQGEETAQAPENLAVPPKPKPCKEAVEALLFAAESPLTPTQIASLLGKVVKPVQVKEWIDLIAREYDDSGRAFQVEEIAGGWRVMTRAEYGHYVRALRITEKTSRLSEAAIDTLSVIAYKQPIIKADINQIRGVESGPILKALIEKDLVKAVGRSEVAGRPIMYGTSKKFLDHFGLNSLKDLPKPEK